MAIIEPRTHDYQDASPEAQSVSDLITRLSGGWHETAKEQPRFNGRIYASDGKTVWWIWIDNEGIPDTASACKYWMLNPFPDPPPPVLAEVEVAPQPEPCNCPTGYCLASTSFSNPKRMCRFGRPQA